MTDETFNKRATKARLSAGWSQDSTYNRFQSTHHGRGRFAAPKSAETCAEALLGVITLALLLVVALLLWGAY